MTECEFREECNTWDELLEVCRDNGLYDTVDCIYDSYDAEEEVNQCMDEHAREYTWQEMRDALNNIPNFYGDCYYYCNSWDDWDELTEDDFEYYKDEVLRIMEGSWDEDENEYDETDESELEETVFESEDEELEDEDFSVLELMNMCNDRLKEIKSNTNEDLLQEILF